MQLEPGFSCLREKIAKMSTVDKLAVLCVDEMSIKVALEYDSHRDVVDGVKDDGEVRTQKLANEALVFMVRGLCKQWKQPLAYFLSDGGITGNKLRHLLLQCLLKLHDIGVQVKLVVCDQGANNRSLFTNLGICIEQPFVEFSGHKVFFIFDPPHLLKSIKNNFGKYPIKFAGGTASACMKAPSEEIYSKSTICNFLLMVN